MFRFTRNLLPALMLLALGGIHPALAQDLSDRLEHALYLEEIKRDVPAAISTYEEMLHVENGHPELLMQARFRLAACHLKQGDSVAARSVLDDVVDSFPDVDTWNDAPPKPVTVDHSLRQIMDMALPDLDREELLSAAFEGLVESLGETADYFDPEELELFQTNMTNTLVGIGAMLKVEEGRLIVTGVIQGGPAEKAGLTPRDEILEIDDRPFADFKDLNHAIVSIRGQEGSTIRLKVRLVDSGDTHVFSMKRAEITLKERGPVLPAVQDEWFLDNAGEVGAILLSSFTQNAAELLKERIDDLLGQGMKALVIDMRRNGGGSLAAAHATADLFLDDGLIVAQHYRNREAKEYHAEAGDDYTFPVAIVVDRHTASAAEIVAAALQDHQRATIIGEQTFGKGTVETIVKVAGGGALKVPISTFVRPSGESLRRLPDAQPGDQWGVQPDPGQEAVVPRINRRIPRADQLAADIPLQKALAACRAQFGN